MKAIHGGKAHLKWAFSEAAVLCLRKNPMAQQYVARLAQKHGKAKALTILAHKLAVYYMLNRAQAFDATKCFPGTAPREAVTPKPSLDTVRTKATMLDVHDASRSGPTRDDLEGGRIWVPPENRATRVAHSVPGTGGAPLDPLPAPRTARSA